jgi:enamine deaminase RidA (YjgF/YER057c/UK114 family)
VIKEYFGDHFPTSTTVEVGQLVVDGLCLEVALIAAL